MVRLERQAGEGGRKSCRQLRLLKGQGLGRRESMQDLPFPLSPKARKALLCRGWVSCSGWRKGCA
jgi:hypothetical protein